MNHAKPALILLGCLLILFFSMFFASTIQSDFGSTNVSDVSFTNSSGLTVRAKLMKPKTASPGRKIPGVVHIHGYPSSREKGDPLSIELSRRGIAVLSIDVLGRGNSSPVRILDGPGFDPSYGAIAALRYLRQLPYVDTNAIGMAGHSLGGQFSYETSLSDPDVRSLVIMGYGYDLRATPSNPGNMLMIFGDQDEYRYRMTKTKDFKNEWLSSPATGKVIPSESLQFNKTFGDFTKGTAREIFTLSSIHTLETHNKKVIKRSLEWFRDSLHPEPSYWKPSEDQIWQIKELLTLLAYLAGFISLLPLSRLLLSTPFFRPVVRPLHKNYECKGKSYTIGALINGVLVWLYLPLILILFLTHIHIIRIDRLFPMMTTNAVTWWFFATNLIGFFLFRSWFRKQNSSSGLTLGELGISHSNTGFHLDKTAIGKTIILGLLLVLFAYSIEVILEKIFLVDYHFVFAFASDLTFYRLKCALLYFPFLLAGFIFNGIFLYGRMRRPWQGSWTRSYVHSSIYSVLLMIVPIILFLCVQYLPIYLTGHIPLVGPGSIFVFLIINLYHIIGVLIVIIPLSSWFYQKTGTIYLGALVNALLVAWMFASTQVIAPMPV